MICLFLALVAMLFNQSEPSEVLINFDRGQHEDHFCEIILILDQWFWRFHLKIFIIYSSANPFSAAQNEILVEGVIRNISVKLF